MTISVYVLFNVARSVYDKLYVFFKFQAHMKDLSENLYVYLSLHVWKL